MLRAFGELLSGSDEQAHQAALRLIMEFPESSYSGAALNKIQLERLDQEQLPAIREAITRIQSVFAGSKHVSENARKLLEKLGN